MLKLTPIVWAHYVECAFDNGNLTRAWRDVLLRLQDFRGADGLIFPSHESLAAKARCTVRTVQRALNEGKRLGLVAWEPRYVREGWRSLRSSNAYTLLIPHLHRVMVRSREAIRTDGLSYGEQRSKKVREPGLWITHQPVDNSLLVARRRVMEERLLWTAT